MLELSHKFLDFLGGNLMNPKFSVNKMERLLFKSSTIFLCTGDSNASHVISLNGILKELTFSTRSQ